MRPISPYRTAIVFLICCWGIVAAFPNLYYARVETHNDAQKQIDSIEEIGGSVPQYLINESALWPSFLPSALVNLGLDLRGGAHLVAEVQLDEVYEARLDTFWPDVRDALNEKRDQFGNIRRQASRPEQLRVSISSDDPLAIEQALGVVRALATPVASITGAGQSDIEVSAEGNIITIVLSEYEKNAIKDRTLQQSVEIVRRRIDEVGTREPTIQKQGSDRILIQVPGLGSAAELKSLIGSTAKLTFHPVLRRTQNAQEIVGQNELLLPSIEDRGLYYIVEKTPVVSGESLVDAQPSFDQNNRPAVSFRFNPGGARSFGDYTAQNIGQPFAIVLDDEVISAPVIQSHIPGGSGIISGSFSLDEATQMAILLRAGALPAKMIFLEERTIGPELGQDSIDSGKRAAIIGMVAVIVVMILSYGIFGFFAASALVINVALIFAILSTIGGTLTLPGIAGIVLTVGMAVDANVLVFERIREEIRNSKNPGRAVEMGYEKARSAIIDANITTMIGAIVLFTLGAGPVRGFAVTLGIGIITSIFSALFVTQLMITFWLRIKRPKKIEV